MTRLTRKKADTKPETNRAESNSEGSPFELLYGGEGNMELQLSEKQKLVFSISQNKETKDVIMDIRVHVTSKKYMGLTSKGITVSTTKLEEFSDLVGELIANAHNYHDEDHTGGDED